MEYIVSVVIVIDSIVSVNRNYEKRKGKRQAANGRSLVASLFLLILSKPLLNRFHEFSDLRRSAGNIALIGSLAHGVTRLLVCPVSKATRTSSHARRLSLERIRLSIAVSMIGVRSAL